MASETLSLENPGSGEVVVKLLASPIHPSDLGMIGGSYGKLRDLPATAGREGAGEVVAIGEGVTDLSVGDCVRMPEDKGTWQSFLCAPAEAFEKIPASLPAEQAAMAFVNPPTAWRLLEDFVDFQSGDWIIQNAANSAVGQCVIQLAHARGLRTINVVRDSKWEEPLKQIGADVVVTEESDYHKKLKEFTGGAKPRLGLNSIGGESVSRIIRCMADGGTVVTFGGMTGEATRFPTRFLIFNDVRLVGFWMDRWFRQASEQDREAMMQSIYEAIRTEKMRCPVDTAYPLSEYKEALHHASSGGRLGKILFKND